MIRVFQVVLCLRNRYSCTNLSQHAKISETALLSVDLFHSQLICVQQELDQLSQVGTELWVYV